MTSHIKTKINNAKKLLAIIWVVGFANLCISYSAISLSDKFNFKSPKIYTPIEYPNFEGAKTKFFKFTINTNNERK